MGSEGTYYEGPDEFRDLCHTLRIDLFCEGVNDISPHLLYQQTEKKSGFDKQLILIYQLDVELKATYIFLRTVSKPPWYVDTHLITVFYLVP